MSKEKELRLYPVTATVESERAGVRMGKYGMGWNPSERSSELYYEVARSDGEAARKFRERTKTGSNGHSFTLGRAYPEGEHSRGLLRIFVSEAERLSLGRYYSDFSDDSDVVAFLSGKNE